MTDRSRPNDCLIGHSILKGVYFAEEAAEGHCAHHRAERSTGAAPLDVETLTTTEDRCCGLSEREHPTWPVYSNHPFGWPGVLAKAWRSYFETHMDELKADVAEAHRALAEGTDR